MCSLSCSTWKHLQQNCLFSRRRRLREPPACLYKCVIIVSVFLGDPLTCFVCSRAPGDCGETKQRSAAASPSNSQRRGRLSSIIQVSHTGAGMRDTKKQISLIDLSLPPLTADCGSELGSWQRHNPRRPPLQTVQYIIRPIATES